jgi:hypothetical protein
MSNLGFELWWAGDTTILLTTQPQVGSRSWSPSEKTCRGFLFLGIDIFLYDKGKNHVKKNTKKKIRHVATHLCLLSKIFYGENSNIMTFVKKTS